MYKVVHKIGTDLKSACRNSSILSENDRITYTPGEWTKPKIEGSGLFYFTELESAKNFIKQYWWDNCEIWECSIKGKMKVPPFIGGRNLKRYWQRIIDKKKKKKGLNFQAYEIEMAAMSPPMNTGMAKMIRLDKLVESV